VPGCALVSVRASIQAGRGGMDYRWSVSGVPVRARESATAGIEGKKWEYLAERRTSITSHGPSPTPMTMILKGYAEARTIAALPMQSKAKRSNATHRVRLGHSGGSRRFPVSRRVRVGQYFVAASEVTCPAHHHAACVSQSRVSLRCTQVTARRYRLISLEREPRPSSDGRVAPTATAQYRVRCVQHANGRA
jgi:hypothetical protein